MRITSGRMIELAAAATTRNQGEVAEAARAVTTGLRVERASDDPAAWARAERAKLRGVVLAGETAAVETGRQRLAETDAALGSIGDAIARVRELAVQGASGTYNAADRAALAGEVRALAAAALGAANTRGSDGDYLLGGSRSTTPPFDAAGVYGGDGLARELSIGEGVTASASIAGSALTATAGVDVLPLLEQVAARLAADDPAGVGALLADLETATKQVAAARSLGGGALAVLDETVAAHGQLAEHLAGAVAGAVELDTVAAASALAKASHALDVSRAVSSHVIALVAPK